MPFAGGTEPVSTPSKRSSTRATQRRLWRISVLERSSVSSTSSQSFFLYPHDSEVQYLEDDCKQTVRHIDDDLRLTSLFRIRCLSSRHTLPRGHIHPSSSNASRLLAANSRSSDCAVLGIARFHINLDQTRRPHPCLSRTAGQA